MVLAFTVTTATVRFHLLVHCCVTDDDYYEDDEEDDPDALKDPIYQVDLQVRYLVTVSPM